MKSDLDTRQILIEQAVQMILLAIGEDPTREGLIDTPRRVAKMYLNELTTGIGQDPREYLRRQFREENHNELIIVKNIEFSSLCEHHMVPYIGKVSIGYIPNGTIVGISKLGRLVEVLSKTLSIQERLTSQVADIIMEELNPKGVMVIMEARHMCMVIRGVKKPDSSTVTSAVRGMFCDDSTLRSEFLSLVR